MKQIARIKLVLAAFLFLSSLLTVLAVFNPQPVFAAGCATSAGSPVAADAQGECIRAYKDQCKKDFPRLKAICDNLTVAQINKCASGDKKLKKSCVEDINKSIKQCLKFNGQEVTTENAKEYQKLNCDTSEGGPCQGVYSGGKGGYVCNDPTAEDSSGDTISTQYDENDCNASFDSLDGDNCGVLRYILLITNVLSGLAATVIVAMMIVGGIQYSAAGADPSKVQAAKQKIINALLALALFIFGFALLQWLIPGGLF